MDIKNACKTISICSLGVNSEFNFCFDIDVDDDGKDETNASHVSSLRFLLLLSQFELLDPSSSFSSSSSMDEEILFFEEIFESFLDFERWAKHVYATIMLKVFTINTMMQIPLRVNVAYFHHRENDEVLSSSSLNSHFVFLGSSPSDSSTFAALSSSPLDFAELSSSLDVSNLPSL